jgi:hypothetical protein
MHGEIPVHVRFHKSFADEVEEHQATASSKLDLLWARTTPDDMSSSGSLSSAGIMGPAFAESEPQHIDSASHQIIVKELYPRLLYTFSDVVCFITNNPK